MDYIIALLWLLGAYVIFRVTSFVISSAIKMVFLVAFISLTILIMSSSVGLL